MATYVEYIQEDGNLLLVEVEESAGQAVKASDVDGNTIIKAGQNFKNALKSVKSSIATLRQEFTDLQVEDVEITFGIKTVGEVGLFAICKAGGEMNYEVKLKWTKKQ